MGVVTPDNPLGVGIDTDTNIDEIGGNPIANQINGPGWIPVTLFDAGANPIQRIQADGQTPLGSISVTQQIFNGATWDRLRTPNTFKSVAFTSVAATNIWTPAAGKKFRLMRYKIKITANALQAVAGVITVQFNDSASAMAITEDFFVPTVAGAVLAEDDTPWIDLSNGILSTVANNILTMTLNTALTGGNFKILVAGTEE